MIRTIALIPAFGFALSACGGSGGGDVGLDFRAADVDGASARIAAGGSPPDVSAGQAKSQQAAIVGSFDAGHMTARLEVNWDGEFYRNPGLCDTRSCYGVPEIYRDSAFEPVMTKNGIRLARSALRRAYGDADGGGDTTLGYGGWMDHSAFAVHIETQTYDNGTFINWVTGYGVALGDATGANNPSSGTLRWNGVMVGRNTDIASAGVSQVIQGDAVVSAELASSGGMSVDVTFSDIKNLNTRESLADMTWSDLAVIDGSFASRSIEGSFFGPQHEEVAGAFERNQVVGAFGARR